MDSIYLVNKKETEKKKEEEEITCLSLVVKWTSFVILLNFVTNDWSDRININKIDIKCGSNNKKRFFHLLKKNGGIKSPLEENEKHTQLTLYISLWGCS